MTKIIYVENPKDPQKSEKEKQFRAMYGMQSPFKF